MKTLQKTQIQKKNDYFLLFLFISSLLLSSFFFQNKNDMGVNWSFPYFSGAANFKELFLWEIDKDDFEGAHTFYEINDYSKYKHNRGGQLIENQNINHYGYLLVALCSQKLFPFLGDIEGIVLFQLLIHAICCWIMLFIVFEKTFFKYGFLILYVSNPLIIYFVTFPFYYFFTFLPSMILSIMLLRTSWIPWLIYLGLPFLVISILIRSSSVGLLIPILVTSYWYSQTAYQKFSSVFIGIVLGLTRGIILYSDLDKERVTYHKPYLGLAAYHKVGKIDGVFDRNGYKLFYEKTGINMKTAPIFGNFGDPEIKNPVSENFGNPEVRKRYNKILKESYLEILNNNPVVAINNAFYNLALVFSIGYIVDSKSLTYLNILLGTLILFFLVFCGQFVFALSAIFGVVTFILYFPPVPAYNFSSYFLISIGILRAINSIIDSRKNEN